MTGRQLSFRERVVFSLLGFGLATVATLGLIELVLQVGALFVGPRALELSGSGDEAIVLCLGDSNTYGVFYSQEKAYPDQLQEILDRRAPGLYRTLNLGLPGMNSSQVATRLEAWIDEYRPRAVIVGVGINNYWNVSDSDAQTASRRSILDRSRLYRFIRLLLAETTSERVDSTRPELDWVLPEEGVTHNETFDADTGKLLIVHEGNWKDWNRPHSEVSSELSRDLAYMAELTDKRGVDLFVMTYASVPIPQWKLRFEREQNVNETIRRFSRERGVPLIDLEPRFLEILSPGQPRSLLFASETESHANPVGYREVARLAAQAIHPDSEGGALGAEAADPHAAAVYFFLDRYEDAVIERQRVPFEQVDLRRIRIRNDERRSLFQHPTTTVAFADVPVGERATLEFAIAIHENAWEKPGDGVLFAVDVLGQDGQRVERFSLYLDPKSMPKTRRWVDQRVDLGDLGGQRVTFFFRTLPGPKGNSHFDWSVWAEPRLISEIPEQAP